MKSRFALFVAFSSASIAAVAAGCGGDDVNTTGAGGSGGGASSSSAGSTASSSSTAVSSSSTGGMMSDDTIDMAQEADFTAPGDPIEGELEPTGDVDFYKFEGSAGQAVYIGVAAEGIDGVRFNPDYIDTVVTLYGPDQKQFAENNDAIPSFNADSELFTILPATGTYYIRVTDCWTWSKDPMTQCRSPEEKANTAYELTIVELDPAVTSVVADTEKGNDAMSPEPIGYQSTGQGGYFFTEIFGTFTDKADIDVFSFSLPNDISSAPGTRSTAYFYLLPPGKSGSGSTTSIGRFYITEAANPLVPVAEIYGGQNAELSPPLPTGKDYLLWVTHPDLAFEANDFYFTRHYGGYANPVEVAEVANDTLMGAEAVQADANGDGTFSGFIEGDLIGAGTDIDHFKAAVPAAIGDKGTVTVVCSAMRRGSGLRGLTIEVLAKDGTPVANQSALKETATQFALDADVDIPTGATDIYFKLSATQDAMVTSSFYRCGVHFNP